MITDHFTKYAVAIPTRNQTTKTTAEAFYNNVVLHHGLSKCLYSYRSRTTPYNPVGNQEATNE